MALQISNKRKLVLFFWIAGNVAIASKITYDALHAAPEILIPKMVDLRSSNEIIFEGIIGLVAFNIVMFIARYYHGEEQE